MLNQSTRALQACGLCLAAACAPSAVSHTQAPGTAGSALARVTQLCSETRLTSHGHVCIVPITPEQQRHRASSTRLELEGGLAVRLQRINGRGFPEADDEGCVEYRYHFAQGYVVESTGYRQDGVVCDHTRYAEQATQVAHVDAWDRPDFNRERLFTRSLIERDQRGLPVRQRVMASDGTPTLIASASELRWERDERGFEKRVCYFDAQGKPLRTSFGVHCWTYQRDAFGTELKQEAWGVDGKPAGNGDGTHSIVKEADAFGNVLSRTLLDVAGKPLATEPAICPKIVYHRDEFGFTLGGDCLDGAGKPAHFDDGNAGWRVSPDARGQAREYRYYDADGNPIAPEFGYAQQLLKRDELGHITERRYFLADGKSGQEKGAPVVHYEYDTQYLETRRSNSDERGRPWRYKGCASLDTEYDKFRQPLRQTCRGFKGEPVLSSDDVCTTVWRYDARGLVVETRYLDVAGALTDASRGYARKTYSHDAFGAETKSRHYKADGSEVVLPRFSALWVRPPHADLFWPAQSRARALSAVSDARRALLGGLPWEEALYHYGNERVYPVNPGDMGYVSYDTVYQALRAVLEPLKVGEYSEVVELPYGLALYLRTE